MASIIPPQPASTNEMIMNPRIFASSLCMAIVLVLSLKLVLRIVESRTKEKLELRPAIVL